MPRMSQLRSALNSAGTELLHKLRDEPPGLCRTILSEHGWYIQISAGPVEEAFADLLQRPKKGRSVKSVPPSAETVEDVLGVISASVGRSTKEVCVQLKVVGKRHGRSTVEKCLAWLARQKQVRNVRGQGYLLLVDGDTDALPEGRTLFDDFDPISGQRKTVRGKSRRANTPEFSRQ